MFIGTPYTLYITQYIDFTHPGIWKRNTCYKVTGAGNRECKQEMGPVGQDSGTSSVSFCVGYT